jgi:hypothetical protein
LLTYIPWKLLAQLFGPPTREEAEETERRRVANLKRWAEDYFGPTGKFED